MPLTRESILLHITSFEEFYNPYLGSDKLDFSIGPYTTEIHSYTRDDVLKLDPKFSRAVTNPQLIGKFDSENIITVALDLDETLITSCSKQDKLYIRPHTYTLLRNLKRIKSAYNGCGIELILWSRGAKLHVDYVLSIIDPYQELFDHVIAYEHDSSWSETKPLLDLPGRDEGTIIIVDDNPIVIHANTQKSIGLDKTVVSKNPSAQDHTLIKVLQVITRAFTIAASPCKYDPTSRLKDAVLYSNLPTHASFAHHVMSHPLLTLSTIFYNKKVLHLNSLTFLKDDCCVAKMQAYRKLIEVKKEPTAYCTKPVRMSQTSSGSSSTDDESTISAAESDACMKP